MSNHYGNEAAQYFRLPPMPVLRSSMLQTPDVTITRLTSTPGAVNLTDPIPPENAFVLCLQLQPLPRHELWLDGKPEHVTPYARGAVSAVDLAARPSAFLPTAFDCLQFYLPEASLQRIAAAEDCTAIRELAIPHGIQDPFVAMIGELLLPALAGNTVPQLFVDGLLIALHSHLAATYSGVRVADARKTGALAPWQELRAKAMIDAHLEDGLSILELAAACELSPAYFCRAFRRSTGLAPHQWLMRRRIDIARGLLERGTLSITEIAISCGFSDQSHFTRVFSQMTGATPRAWRQARQ
ncbi:helix-turn-helix transcriptional regulator [Paraburkholderia sp. LEh10]|uniref:helix-turn-helix transcriptional regulator n=1 Tax=Paraburkholderia sp. LEh10 TaxID=2821353 RepID=UPI001AE5A248|nr:AraC family transcriptional regulator [Paraburkholderia sp. LEh10]MBP0593010.1 helix-turn-helix transcriptional regulator [Paraburkholderia sp. LEh10]